MAGSCSSTLLVVGTHTVGELCDGAGADAGADAGDDDGDDDHV